MGMSFIEVAHPSHTHSVAALLQNGWATAAMTSPIDNVSTALLVVPVLIGFAFLLLIMFSFVHLGGHKQETPSSENFLAQSYTEGDVLSTPSLPPNGAQLKPWCTQAIVALTSYRFYTGFLSATWMPYLLAMEGQELMGDRQSVFMGSAKLIYGLSVLLNPLFGLLGDQSATISQWSGRRLFILVGVVVSALGIYGCLVAAHMHSVPWYLTSTVLWMLGEAMADVTTETLVPELLPRSQYEIASSVRALNFLLGGLTGFAMLIAFRHMHFSWLYYAYLILMTLCAALSLVFVSTGEAQPTIRSNRDAAFSVLMAKAYVLPTRVEGGFPRACLSLFIFSLGSAPMFFLLLMLRDIVGVIDPPVLQMHFSLISIAFFLCAALAASAGALSSDSPKEHTDAASSSETVAPTDAVCIPATRWPLMVFSAASFSVVCAVIPVSGLFGDLQHRLLSFYLLASLLGLSFGAVYARFQDCTWSLLPDSADIANLMGFAAMCKMAGVGIGNFAAGWILDLYKTGRDTNEFKGYVFMSFFCALVVAISTVLTWSVGNMALAAEQTSKRRSGENDSSESSQNPHRG